SLVRLPHPRSTPFPYTTLFRSVEGGGGAAQLGGLAVQVQLLLVVAGLARRSPLFKQALPLLPAGLFGGFGFGLGPGGVPLLFQRDRKSTRLNSSHVSISYAVFC